MESRAVTRLGWTCPGAKLALLLLCTTLDDLTWTTPSARLGRRPALDLDGGVAALGRFLASMVHLVELLIWTDSSGKVELMEAEITTGAGIWPCVGAQWVQRLVKMLVAFRLGLQPELDLDG